MLLLMCRPILSLYLGISILSHPPARVQIGADGEGPGSIGAINTSSLAEETGRTCDSRTRLGRCPAGLAQLKSRLAAGQGWRVWISVQVSVMVVINQSTFIPF